MEALAVAPVKAHDYYREARRLADRGQTEEALRHLDQARKEQPPSEWHFLRAAGMLRDTGDLDRALRFVQQGLQTYPANFDLWEKRTSIELAAADFAAVERSLAGASSITPAKEARVLVLRARLAHAKWAFDEARDLLTTALKCDATNTSALFGLVHLDLLRFDLFEAKRGLERQPSLSSTGAG